jgi:hypothetical protein
MHDVEAVRVCAGVGHHQLALLACGAKLLQAAVENMSRNQVHCVMQQDTARVVTDDLQGLGLTLSVWQPLAYAVTACM